MTTRNRILLAIGLFAIPILLRFFFFYQFPYYNFNVQKPDYASYKVPEPPTPSSHLKTETSAISGEVVLIDMVHGNQFDPSEIEPLVTDISSHGARVEYDSGAKSLEMQLKYASAYIVFAPTTNFNGDEIRLIQQFVDSGGRLLVFSDPTRAMTSYDFFGNPTTLPDVNYTNPLVAPYGLSLANDYLYNLESNEGNFRNVKFTTFADNPLTKDLHMVVFYGAHSIHADNGTALATGDDKTFSSLTDAGGGLTPIAVSKNGQVLVSGDFSFMTNPFNQVADNAVLLSNITDFAVGGKRSPALANFPFVFQHPVSLITTGNVSLTSDMLQPVALLQNSLKAVNISISVRSEAPSEGDLIVLGTFAPSDDLAPYLKPFNIDLKDATDTLKINGFGQISTTGSGLMLFNTGPKSNTLVLLAPTEKDLPELVTLVASGDLSACVLQDGIGVCSLNSASSAGSDFSNFYLDLTPTPFDSLQPTEVPTATPSG